MSLLAMLGRYPSLERAFAADLRPTGATLSVLEACLSSLRGNYED